MFKKIAMFSLLVVFQPSVGQCGTLKINLSRYYPNIQGQKLSDHGNVPGLYSASLDNQIIYLDENAQYMFSWFDGSFKRSKEPDQGLGSKAKNSIDWKQLPLKDAIKTVKGNGKQQLAIFQIRIALL